jgi:hypothetical protein
VVAELLGILVEEPVSRARVDAELRVGQVLGEQPAVLG